VRLNRKIKKNDKPFADFRRRPIFAASNPLMSAKRSKIEIVLGA